MANTKISALTSATTPLDGTEVLPIVQSSTTKKVANNDLRPKQIQSNATSGVLQVTGPGAGTTRVMTTPNANFTAARTDAAQSFTGDQTLSTGNLVQGTAAKGVNFTANTPAAGMTSQLLNWYEEGTFTPTYGGSTSNPTVTYSNQTGYFTRIGRMVTFVIKIVTTSSSGGSGNLKINGLPYTALADGGVVTLNFSYAFASNVLGPAVQNASILLYDSYAGTSNTLCPVSALTSAGGSTFIVLGGTYMV